MLTIYTYAKCSTCRRATAWLRDRGLAFEERPIRETPPGTAELRRMLEAHGGNLRRLFNTSGEDYRAMGLSAVLPTLGEAEAFALLSTRGNLVRRPFLLGPGVALVGFDEAAWSAAVKRG